MSKKTLIQVNEEQKTKLDNIKEHPTDTYEAVIQRLLEAYLNEH